MPAANSFDLTSQERHAVKAALREVVDDFYTYPDAIAFTRALNAAAAKAARVVHEPKDAA